MLGDEVYYTFQTTSLWVEIYHVHTQTSANFVFIIKTYSLRKQEKKEDMAIITIYMNAGTHIYVSVILHNFWKVLLCVLEDTMVEKNYSNHSYEH